MATTGHRSSQPDTASKKNSDRGATAIEYSIMASLIAGIIVLIVTALGLDVLALWSSLSW